MRHWRRLLAALLAALPACALSLAALAEPVIDGDDGLSLELEGDTLEIADGLGLDVALLKIELAAPEAIVADLAPLANEGEEGEDPGETEEEDDGFDIEDGVVVGYHGEGGDITIPERATAIGQWAFAESPLVTGVTIPGNIQDIGEGCFYHCPNLTRLTIMEGATAIHNSAFEGCPKLEKVTVPDSVKQTGNGAFNGCSKLNQLSLGNGIEGIGMGAFYACSSLTKLGTVQKLFEHSVCLNFHLLCCRRSTCPGTPPSSTLYGYAHALQMKTYPTHNCSTNFLTAP